MAEPFAAVFINTLFNGRGGSVLGNSQSISAAMRTAKSSRHPSMAYNFFTPLPRPTKGKGRESVCSNPGFVAQCREWSCSVTRHSALCLDARYLILQQEFNSPRDYSCRRRNLIRFMQSGKLRNRVYQHRTSILDTSSGPRKRSTHTVDRQESMTSQISGRSSSSQATSVPYAKSSAPAAPSVPPEADDALRRIVEMSDEGTRQLDIQAFWKLYQKLRSFDADRYLSPSERLSIATKMLQRVEDFSNPDLGGLQKWGTRINSVLEPVKPRVSPSLETTRLQCLRTRCLALKGKISEAQAMLQEVDGMPSVYREQSHLLSTIRGILQSINLHQDGFSALCFFLKYWTLVEPHMSHSRSIYNHAETADASIQLRHSVYKVVRGIQQPYLMLAANRAWELEQRQRLGSLLVSVLTFLDVPLDAHMVYREMQAQRIPLSDKIKLSLVWTLVRESYLELAADLYSSLPSKMPELHLEHLQTGLYLASHQGNEERSQALYDELTNLGLATANDFSSLLHAYGMNGKTDVVKAIFDENFPEDEGGFRQGSPSVLFYSVIIFAHAQKADFEGINYWLNSMKIQNLEPSLHIYGNIMKSFALRGDVDSISTVLAQMRTAGVKPNLVIYTTIVHALARRGDPMSAEAIYKRAISEGIIPDRHLIAAIMNAHVEAGSWKGVIRVFDYLRTVPNELLHLNIIIYNTLLKAYVLIGAPFRVVSRLFARLEQSPHQPDPYTFSLLIQSACDSGEMKIASEVFYEMDKLTKSRPNTELITTYSMTILMSGFLRVNDKIRAKAVYDEMNLRGIKPTAVTFHAILRAYGNEKSQESMQVAEKFVQQLVDGDRSLWDAPNTRKTALELIYGPLIYSYSKQRNVEDAERMYQQMLDQGGEPGLGLLTYLLDLYRKTLDIDAVLDLWPQIYDLGLKRTSVDLLLESEEYDPTLVRLQKNILCIPLSIYIDACSAAGLHDRIATAWRQFQLHGFAFDSHNWNHLIVALVRAGEVERAFEVLEKVILPYQKKSDHYRPLRDLKPASPLLFEDKSNIDAAKTEVPLKPPMHHAANRQNTVRVATSRLASNEEITSEEHADDFAHALHILHQISPTWNVWRPHNAALSVLLMVLTRLQYGGLIEPVKSSKPVDDIPLDEQQQQEKATALLDRIAATYPESVRTVLEFDRLERYRLGDEYDRTYTWR